jgi:hypothetical protein
MSLPLGEALLRARGLFPESYWYWIGVGALIGYTVLFNILFTFFLAYLNRKPFLFVNKFTNNSLIALHIGNQG